MVRATLNAVSRSAAGAAGDSAGTIAWSTIHRAIVELQALQAACQKGELSGTILGAVA